MTYLLFTTLFLASLALAVRPFLARRAIAWPAEAPDARDDVARAVSGLRDLEFARAAGTIAPEDHARLRALLERSAFVSARPETASPAPWRPVLVAADRVLTLRPKDPDALFLKGLIEYRAEDWKGAVDTWAVFLEVGQFDEKAAMVRPLYEDAKQRLGR